MKFGKILFSLLLFTVFLSAISFAQDMKNDKMLVSTNKMDVAINGYDPVAYFTVGKAEMGKSDYSYKWRDAEWYFADKNDMQKFMKNPEMYAPEFGGYCAYAAGRDMLVKSDPTAWTIKDNKLYLNKNAEVKQLFKKDIDNNIKMANKEWPGLCMNEGKKEEKMMDN
jgi:YHS domain-containing protein